MWKSILFLEEIPKKELNLILYTELLLSFPFVSENIACTLIGVIGDIDRFNTYKEFKKYLGVSAENSQSGTSVRSAK
ncbi:transposase [Bacillus chungangensis]